MKQIFSTVPEDEFVDREDVLDHLYYVAIRTARRATENKVIIGRRRVGKTSVLTRLYEKLFWEQGEVVPIYYSFEGRPLRVRTFSEEYFRHFVIQYLAFRRKDPILAKASLSLGEVLKEGKKIGDRGLLSVIQGFEGCQAYEDLVGMLSVALRAPRWVADENDGSLCVILDEFQSILYFEDIGELGIDMRGAYQAPVESFRATYIVSGSAVTIIHEQIIGRGPLLGRFMNEYLEALSRQDALALGEKLARKFGLVLPQEQNVYLAEYTGDLPFYIRWILLQADEILSNKEEKMVTKEVLSEAIAAQMVRGGIYNALEEQFLGYTRLNNERIARTILYKAADFEDHQIIPAVIAQELKVHEDRVEEILSELARADLIERRNRISRLNVFFNVPDPVMRRYLRLQYEREVEAWPVAELRRERREELLAQLRDLKRINGLLLESHIKFLMTTWDGREAEGELFGVEGPVRLPRFERVYDTRVKPPGSREYQIDALGELLTSEAMWVAWAVESKYRGRKASLSDVRKFDRACSALEQHLRIGDLTKWFVSANGFTQNALAEAQKRRMLVSDLGQLNELLGSFGLKRVEIRDEKA